MLWDVLDLDVLAKTEESFYDAKNTHITGKFSPFIINILDKDVYGFIRDRTHGLRVDYHVQQPGVCFEPEYVLFHEQNFR